MRRAFTLIEILVVLAIISLLMALMIGGISYARERARLLLTVHRMEEVHNALARYGGERQELTYALQRDIPGLGGTPAYARGASDAFVSPADGSPWHAVFPAAAAVAPGHASITHTGTGGSPLVMAYPWGRHRRYAVLEDWYVNRFTPPLPITDTDFLPLGDDGSWNGREPHRIHELWPRQTTAILHRIGIADSEANARDDRDRDRPWNDAWGRPLVVAYAIYQPPRCLPASIPAWNSGTTYEAGAAVAHNGSNWIAVSQHAASGANTPGTSGSPWRSTVWQPDQYLKEAQRRYGYNRALYVAVGSAGPDLDPSRFVGQTLHAGQTATQWGEVLTGLWEQVCEVTMPTIQDEWREWSFESPPWQVHRQRTLDKGGASLRCTITAPVEYR
jgi:prepilin-type N-terminal cleavage/methylation domain-containing protein